MGLLKTLQRRVWHQIKDWQELSSSKLINLYTIVIVSVGLVTLIRGLLHPILDYRSSYLIFTISVILAAWWGGRTPALIALVLGGVIGNTLFVEPYLSFAFKELADLINLGFYLIVGEIIIEIFEMQKRQQKRLNAILAQSQ